MAINTLEPLDWDSRFFGYRVARISLAANGTGVLAGLFEQLASEKIRLAYLFVSPAENEINERIVKNGGELIDQKTTFMKTTEEHVSFDHRAVEFSETGMDENLKRLVLQSGEFSRFRLDKRFIANEYERLYVEWLRKSLNKTIAFKTFVAREGTGIAGLITLGKKKEHADIGLVAVDEKYRGRGIGRDLIRFADNEAFAMGFKQIQVVTQLKNKGACRLYEKCNFKMSNITNVYHYWRS